MTSEADHDVFSDRERKPLDEAADDAGVSVERVRGSDKKWKRVADTRPMPTMDADVYSTKKTVAQGFMDLALLSANADQLRNLVRTGDTDSVFFTVCVVFLSLSICLQVLIAIGLMLKGRYNINQPRQFRAAETVNNTVMVASVLLTAVNVLTTSFMPEVPRGSHGAAEGVAQATQRAFDTLVNTTTA